MLLGDLLEGFLRLRVPERMHHGHGAGELRAAATDAELHFSEFSEVDRAVIVVVTHPRRQQEQVYREEIQRRFSEFPLLWIPQFESDIYGLSNLERVSSLFR